eukprot:scaffold29860_cov17-Tisochrysis_lutea.AAC.1
MSTIEPLTSNKEESVPIRVSLRAVFSKYAITPARGINFGPHTYNTTSKPRTFEITNLGGYWSPLFMRFACSGLSNHRCSSGCVIIRAVEPDPGARSAPMCSVEHGAHQSNIFTQNGLLAAWDTGDFSFNYRLFNFASPPTTKLSTAAPVESKDKK